MTRKQLKREQKRIEGKKNQEEEERDNNKQGKTIPSPSFFPSPTIFSTTP